MKKGMLAFWREIQDEIAWLRHFLRSTLKYVSVAVLLVFIWGFIGTVSRTYDFWDDAPDRGALSSATDPYDAPVDEILYLDQGWEAEDSLWFYTTTQGSNLIPYSFFLALEQRDRKLPFRHNDNINRYRYLPQRATFSNADGLPVGMTRDVYRGKAYFGFTCAACHTSQINYADTGIRIDGGPAAADMERFMVDLAGALQATRQHEEKYRRFVNAVLDYGDYDDEAEIRRDLDKYTQRLLTYTIINDPGYGQGPATHYGYARLDAFGRIYNRVLEHVLRADQIAQLLKENLAPEKSEAIMRDIQPILEGDDLRHLLSKIEAALAAQLSDDDVTLLRSRIFNPADAPVSYPFLWDIPQHDYVQWNGAVANSGLGPMGRNAGQVIGVFGTLDWQEKKGFGFLAWLSGQGAGDHVELTSSVNTRNLRRVEFQLRRLQSPQWPEAILGSIDKTRAARGKKLYDAHCVNCHEYIDRADKDRRVIAYMSHIDRVGTDPKMALNSTEYFGYSGILEHQYVDLDKYTIQLRSREPMAALLTSATRSVITSPDPDKWWVESTAERFFDIAMTLWDNEVRPSIKRGDYEPDTGADPVASLRSYKARPLNGIWATAPYLHNGSVPSLYDLLLPAKTENDSVDGEYRPPRFFVGSREFDPERVGFRYQGYPGFEFDTSLKGNSNRGHEYGTRTLDAEKRLDLLEFLKTL